MCRIVFFIGQEHKEAGIAIVRLNPMEKLKANPKSMRASINASCWQCQGEDADPSVQWTFVRMRIWGGTKSKTADFRKGTPYLIL